MQLADKLVGDIVLEERLAFIVHARPAPHVLVVTVVSLGLQDCCTDGPHDDAEDEEDDGEGSVVNSGLLCLSMSSFPVSVEYEDACYQ